MCGILGYTLTGRASADMLAKFERLFILTQTRGAHASGVAWATGDEIHYRKAAQAATRFVRGDGYARMKRSHSRLAIAHTRWATNGHPSKNENNHPHMSENGALALVHNGMIFNWEQLKVAERLPYASECDSEVIMRLTEKMLGRKRKRGEILRAIRRATRKIMGSASFALMSAQTNTLFLVCHRNPVHLLRIDGVGVVFASEAGPLYKVFGEDADVRVMSEDTVITASGDSYDIVSTKFKEYIVPKAALSRYEGASRSWHTPSDALVSEPNDDGTTFKGWYDPDNDSRWERLMTKQNDDVPSFTFDGNGQVILDSERSFE